MNPPYSALLLTLHSCTVPPACILKALPRTSTVDTKDRQLLLKDPSKAKARVLKELLPHRPTLLPKGRSLPATLTPLEDRRLLTRTRGLILKVLPCLCRLEDPMFR